MGLGFTYKEKKKETVKAISYFLKSAKLSDSIKTLTLLWKAIKTLEIYMKKKWSKTSFILLKNIPYWKIVLMIPTKNKMDDTLKEIVENKQIQQKILH